MYVYHQLSEYMWIGIHIYFSLTSATAEADNEKALNEYLTGANTSAITQLCLLPRLLEILLNYKEEN